MIEAQINIIGRDCSWIEQKAIDQLHQTAALPGIERAVGLPDLHAGQGIPVGAAFWSRNYIYPHLVGNDIGCGMAVWRTDMPTRKFKKDKIARKLTGLDDPWTGDVGRILDSRALPRSLDIQSLGTIGGGNHFAEFQIVENVGQQDLFDKHGFDANSVYLLTHSGSRGIGEAILRRHVHTHQSCGLDVGSDGFKQYIACHDQAMDWAKLNRDIIAQRFLERIGAEADRLLDIFHNSVTPHEGGWLHRKGAAPSDKGLVVIPGSRGTMSYVVAPKLENAEISLCSLAHGAGRKWGRKDAKAKLRKRFSINDLTQTDLGGRVICEDKDLIFEEAPAAYKSIESVIDDLEHAGLISIVAIMRPIVTYKKRRA